MYYSGHFRITLQLYSETFITNFTELNCQCTSFHISKPQPKQIFYSNFYLSWTKLSKTKYLYYNKKTYLFHLFIEHLFQVFVTPHQPGENPSITAQCLIRIIWRTKHAHICTYWATVDAIFRDSSTWSCAEKVTFYYFCSFVKSI